MLIETMEDDIEWMVMGVLVNLTQENASVSQSLARQTRFVQAVLTRAFYCISSEHQEQAHFNLSMRSVCLMVNLLRHCPALNTSVGSMSTSHLFTSWVYLIYYLSLQSTALTAQPGNHAAANAVSQSSSIFQETSILKQQTLKR
jgi:hypothetical protein